MNDTRVATPSEAAAHRDLELQRRLDALVCGECTEDEFVHEILTLLHGAPDSAWNTMAVIHQRYRHGEISADFFRSIASEIVGHELDTAQVSTTSDPPPRVSKDPAISIDDPCPTSSVEIGRVLQDRYVLEKRLGSGRAGTVFKALDRFGSDLPGTGANQYVAIKVLHENANNRLELLAALRREFYCTQMLSHPNVVKVYELERDGDVCFFTMELLEGELLSNVIGRVHPLPVSRAYAWAIIQKLGCGLAHAHARNVLHADLTPHNVMITNAGEVRILGFGGSNAATRLSPEAAPPRRNALGALTPAYSSCELLAGRPADPRDDMYALACIAYELLSGTHPFQFRPSTLARDLGIVPTRPPGLTRPQWHALAMGLSWHRAARSLSVRAWLDKLKVERAAKELPPPRDLHSAPANSRPTASLGVAALFAALLIAITALVSFNRLAPGGRVAHDEVLSTAAVNQDSNTDPVGLHGARDGNAAAGSALREASGPTSETAGTHAQLPNNMRRDADRSKRLAALLSPIIVSSSNYRIRPGEKFAEIRVHRSPRSRSNAAFVWWTEAASAKPGIDYVHQGKVTQSFPKGKSSTSFFIKLIPDASRAESEVFYIAIAEAGHGPLPGEIERTAVWLPTTRDHS